jgi:hypothetical protein
MMGGRLGSGVSRVATAAVLTALVVVLCELASVAASVSASGTDVALGGARDQPGVSGHAPEVLAKANKPKPPRVLSGEVTYTEQRYFFDVLEYEKKETWSVTFKRSKGDRYNWSWKLADRSLNWQYWTQYADCVKSGAFTGDGNVYSSDIEAAKLFTRKYTVSILSDYYDRLLHVHCEDPPEDYDVYESDATVIFAHGRRGHGWVLKGETQKTQLGPAQRFVATTSWELRPAS